MIFIARDVGGGTLARRTAGRETPDTFVGDFEQLFILCVM